MFQSQELKIVHLFGKLLIRWFFGVDQNAFKPSQSMNNLDNFTFFFNRRTAASCGNLFYSLVRQSVMVASVPVTIINYIDPRSD